MKLNMDLLREQTIEYLNSLWQNQYIGGGHKFRPDGYVSIMSTTNAAWIYYMLNATDEIKRYSADACAWLKAQQQPDGRFVHDLNQKWHPKYFGSGASHGMWMVTRTLGIYGDSLEQVPEYLKAFLSADYLDKWFRSIDWKSELSSQHDVLALIPTLCKCEDPEWENVLFGHLASQQEEDTGCWSFRWCNMDANMPNLSRTFAYTEAYTLFGRIPPNADKMIDTVIAAQKETGIWEVHLDTPEYFTMDAVYLLWCIGNRIGYPFEKRREALVKAAEAMNAYFACRPVDKFEELHSLLANLHTIGLLSEALPEMYETSVKWNFDWDKRQLIDVIKNS